MFVGWIHSYENSVEAKTHFTFASTEYEIYHNILCLVKEHQPNNWWEEIEIVKPNSFNFITDKDKLQVMVEGELQTKEELETILRDLELSCDGGEYFEYGFYSCLKYGAVISYNEYFKDQGYQLKKEILFDEDIKMLKERIKHHYNTIVFPFRGANDYPTVEDTLKNTCEYLNNYTDKGDDDLQTSLDTRYQILELPYQKEIERFD